MSRHLGILLALLWCWSALGPQLGSERSGVILLEGQTSEAVVVTIPPGDDPSDPPTTFASANVAVGLAAADRRNAPDRTPIAPPGLVSLLLHRLLAGVVLLL